MGAPFNVLPPGATDLVAPLVHFDMIHERDRRTDRRKNRGTPHDSIDRACISSRGKNAWQRVPVYLQQFLSYSNHNCIAIFTYPGLHFCLPWGRPCGNHAKRMNEKTIQCLPNPSQHVPIYLQQFPSYSNCKCKKNRRNLSSIVSELYDA